MKRQKASNIDFAVTLFMFNVLVKKYTFLLLKLKYRPSAHYLSCPVAIKTKMALLGSGSLEHLICAEDKKNGSAKEKGISSSQLSHKLT